VKREDGEELLITAGTLIDGLRMYPYPIPREVLIVRHFTASFVKDDGKHINPADFTKKVDLKPYIIKALEYMDQEIRSAEEKTRKAQKELEEYKRKSWEFEKFKQFMAEQGRICHF
jgi:hypothetical protein